MSKQKKTAGKAKKKATRSNRRKDQQGKKARPSLVYEYGIFVPKETETVLFEQLRLAHKYRNMLVAAELERRARSDAVLLKHSAELRDLTQQIDQQQTLVQQCKDAIAAANIKHRRRGSADPNLRAAKMVAEDDLKKLYKKQSTLRDKLFKHPTCKSQCDVISNDIYNKKRQARADIVKEGLYWPTAGLVAETRSTDSSGTPPRFTPYNREGRVGGQIQNNRSVDHVMNGRCTFFQIDSPDPNGGKGQWVNARIRIGSDPNNKRKPTWAEFQVKLHRPLPPDIDVTYVWLIARRTAHTVKWSLQISMARDEEFNFSKSRSSHEDDGRCRDGSVVAIDVGWRKTAKGIRVAYMIDDKGEEEEVYLNEKRGKLQLTYMDRMRKVRELQGTRDKEFNTIKKTLGDWVKKRQDIVPKWLSDELSHLYAWKSSKRLAGLLFGWKRDGQWNDGWKNRRFKGDRYIFSKVEAWRKQDRHLFEWERHQALGEQRWRLDFYRRLAKDLSKKYEIAVIEDVDWSVFQRRMNPLSKDDIKKKRALYNEQRKAVAVSILNGALNHRMVQVVKAPAEWTTQQCHSCGHIDRFDAENNLCHTCSNCGTHWDQDANACHNLLARFNASGGASGTAVHNP